MEVRITFGGTHPVDFSKARSDAVILEVWEGDPDTPAFRHAVMMTRQLQVGFRSISDAEQQRIMTARALFELEGELRAGIVKPRPVSERVFHSDEYEMLTRSLATKECLWLERGIRGDHCSAEPGEPGITTKTLCRACEIPDARLICSSLVHPEVRLQQNVGARARLVAAVSCEKGNSPGTGSECVPNGKPCWERVVADGWAVGEPPPDVAARVADEIDFISLVFRDRYGSVLWRIPQARTISALFGECSGAEDFQSRLAAITDLLGKVDVHEHLAPEERKGTDGKKVGAVVALLRLMQRDYPEAAPAVERLRLLLKARNVFPVHSRTDAVVADLRAIGVEYPPGDWHFAWATALTLFLDSLRALRQAMQSAPAAI